MLADRGSTDFDELDSTDYGELSRVELAVVRVHIDYREFFKGLITRDTSKLALPVVRT